MTAVGIDVGKAALDVAIEGMQAVKRFVNSRQGIGQILRYLGKVDAPKTVVEATGGYEDALLEACCDAGIWIARVNPRQARAFARAAGDLAKTDAIDARVLASMGSLLLDRLRQYEAPTVWQRQLRDGLRRRSQVVVTLQAQKQQLALTPTTVRLGMARTIAAIKRELVTIDSAIAALIKTHGTPAIRSCKRLGPIFQAASLALLPELGRLDRRQIARLVVWHRSIAIADKVRASDTSVAGGPHYVLRSTWPPCPQCAGIRS